MKIYRDISQGSPEWFDIRKGKMTASEATAIGNAGKGLENYIDRLMAEYYSNGEKEKFSNIHTDRGHELEDEARQLYAIRNGVDVETVGFIEHSEFVGFSPDGLIVGQPGGLEIKALDDYGFFLMLRDGERGIKSDHRWQCQMALLITGFEWWDYTVYNPNSKVETLLTFRIFPDKNYFEKLEKGFMIGEEKIKQNKDILDKKYHHLTSF